MIVKLIQVHANNIVFTLKIRLYFPKFLTIRIFPCYFFISIRPFFFTFCVFLYIIMYSLNITRAIKRYLSIISETLYLQTIINELGFLRKTVTKQLSIKRLKKAFIVFRKQTYRKNT